MCLVQGDQSIDPFDDLHTLIEADVCGLEAEANEDEEILFEDEGEMEILEDKATIGVTLENTIPGHSICGFTVHT